MSNRFKVGYEGQKYRVTYQNTKRERLTFGWTNDPTGGRLVSSIRKHPAMFNSRVEVVEDKEKENER